MTFTLTPPPPTESPARVAIAARTEEATKVHGTGEAAVVALDHVDVAFAAGELTAIMGPSGSGKSTLLHCLAGLDDLTEGAAFLGDVAWGSLNERRRTRMRRDRVGFVFQSFNLIPTLTAEENITLPLALAGRRPDREWLDHVVDVVGLGSRLSHRPSELSGGQQQRVAVARALVARPDVIFADEPTGALDRRSGGEVLAFLRRAVHEYGQTVVMVTHDPTAAGIADRAVFLADGRVVGELSHPTPASVVDRMQHLED